MEWEWKDYVIAFFVIGITVAGLVMGLGKMPCYLPEETAEE